MLRSVEVASALLSALHQQSLRSSTPLSFRPNNPTRTHRRSPPPPRSISSFHPFVCSAPAPPLFSASLCAQAPACSRAGHPSPPSVTMSAALNDTHITPAVNSAGSNQPVDTASPLLLSAATGAASSVSALPSPQTTPETLSDTLVNEFLALPEVVEMIANARHSFLSAQRAVRESRTSLLKFQTACSKSLPLVRLPGNLRLGLT